MLARWRLCLRRECTVSLSPTFVAEVVAACTRRHHQHAPAAALTALAHRVATHADSTANSHLLAAIAHLSFQAQSTTLVQEVVDYAIEYSSRLTRIDNYHGWYTGGTPDAARPVVAVLAGLHAKGHPQMAFLRRRWATRLLDALVATYSSLHHILTHFHPPHAETVAWAVTQSNATPLHLDVALTWLMTLEHVDEHTLRRLIRQTWLRGLEPHVNVMLQRPELDSTIKTFNHIDDLFVQLEQSLTNDASTEHVVNQLTSLFSIPSTTETFNFCITAFRTLRKPTTAISLSTYMTNHHQPLTASGIEATMKSLLTCPQTTSQVPLLFHESTIVTTTMVSYTMIAFDRSRQFNLVWYLWTSMIQRWTLTPDDRHLLLLLRSARRLTTSTLPKTVQGPILGFTVDTHDKESGYWNGMVASEQAIATFWSILTHQWPNIATDLDSNSKFRIRLFDKLTSPCSLMSRVAKPTHSQDLEAAHVLPSLRWPLATSTPQILPSCQTFKEMIELLGMSSRGRDIPLLLQWMKALHVVPDQALLAWAYIWYLQHGPLTSSVKELDHFVTSWLGVEAIPNDQYAATLLHKRAYTRSIAIRRRMQQQVG